MQKALGLAPSSLCIMVAASLLRFNRDSIRRVLHYNLGSLMSGGACGAEKYTSGFVHAITTGHRRELEDGHVLHSLATGLTCEGSNVLEIDVERGDGDFP